MRTSQETNYKKRTYLATHSRMPQLLIDNFFHSISEKYETMHIHSEIGEYRGWYNFESS